MELILHKCKLRYFKEGDEESIVKNANNKNVWINLRNFFPYPYTLQDAKNWIKQTQLTEPKTIFAIDVEGNAVGSIGFNIQDDVHSRSAEVGYWLGEEHWGRGIATEALTAITKYAFQNFDLVRLYAGVYEWNKTSIRVLEKAGYSFEARLRKAVTKNGVTMDEFLFAKIK
jgi:RimJ/RimL family protein N-acetyltransferase